MTFPNESTIKVNGKWITLVAIPLETLTPTLEEFNEIYKTDLSAEGMMKGYHEALEAQAARQAELN